LKDVAFFLDTLENNFVLFKRQKKRKEQCVEPTAKTHCVNQKAEYLRCSAPLRAGTDGVKSESKVFEMPSVPACRYEPPEDSRAPADAELRRLRSILAKLEVELRKEGIGTT
jgi:hypothetical protein